MGGRHIFTFWKKKESFLSFVIKHSWLQQIKRHVLNKIPNSIQYLLQLACYQMFLELFLVIEIISNNFYISVTYGRNVRNIKDWFWTSLGFYLVEYALLFQWLSVRLFEIFEISIMTTRHSGLIMMIFYSNRLSLEFGTYLIAISAIGTLITNLPLQVSPWSQKNLKSPSR